MGLRHMEFTFEKAEFILEQNLVLFTNTMGRLDGPRAYKESVMAGATFIQTNRPARLERYLREHDLLKGCIPSRNFECWESPDQFMVVKVEPD